MEQVVKSMIETYFKQNGVDNTICQHPAFDLLEIIYQKLLQETNGVQEEVLDQLEQYCYKHTKIENNPIIYQATIHDVTTQENCLVVEAYFYELLSGNRLSKTRITASTDGMESETNSLFEEVYDSTNCFSIEYKKEQSLYNCFGVEWNRILRTYQQFVPKKSQLQQVLSNFPFDPDIWNIPFLSEVFIERTIYLNTAHVQILVPKVHSIPYFCEYGLQIKKSDDLLHLELSKSYFPDLVIAKIRNHSPIPREGIVDYTDEERKAQESQLCNFIQQLSNDQTRDFLLNYIKKEVTYDPEKSLKLTCVTFI